MNRNEGETFVGPMTGTDLEIDLTGGNPAIAPLFDASQMYAMRRGFYLRVVKPLFDRVGALLALIVVSPLMAVVAVAIVMTMGFPVIIRQDRVGLFGKVFTLYKFRTMIPDRRGSQSAEFVGEDRRLTHKSADDPRITPLGRLLRRTRLDELPQFINVLQGDLSLVGPRPEMVSIVALYDPWQHRRHAVKPGITGVWQISDNGDKLLFECTQMELEYLEEVSFSADLSIMLRTLPAMARRGGI
jgi:lipopolysaccharide/colanic/teichoic acid biosynthesis glycosyltransferase